MDKLGVGRSTAVKFEERETRERGRKRGGRKEESGQKRRNTTAVPGCCYRPLGIICFPAEFSKAVLSGGEISWRSKADLLL